MKKLFYCFLIALAAILSSVLVHKFSIPQTSAEKSNADLPAFDAAQEDNITDLPTLDITQDIQLPEQEIVYKSSESTPSSFPRKMPFEVTIPSAKLLSVPNARYCTVSAAVGSVSDSELTLSVENSFEYAFPPDDVDFEGDIIWLRLYDGNNSLIDSGTVSVSYNDEIESYVVSRIFWQLTISDSDPTVIS